MISNSGDGDDFSIANSVYAGLTYCGMGYAYPKLKDEYFVSKTKKGSEFEVLINFDAESSAFKDLCFSTCCWSLFISPDK